MGFHNDNNVDAFMNSRINLQPPERQQVIGRSLVTGLHKVKVVRVATIQLNKPGSSLYQ